MDCAASSLPCLASESLCIVCSKSEIRSLSAKLEQDEGQWPTDSRHSELATVLIDHLSFGLCGHSSLQYSDVAQDVVPDGRLYRRIEAGRQVVNVLNQGSLF